MLKNITDYQIGKKSLLTGVSITLVIVFNLLVPCFSETILILYYFV